MLLLKSSNSFDHFQQFKYKQEGKIEENQGSQIHHQHNFFNRLDERYRRMLLIKEGVQIDEVGRKTY
jgi:hypothetical protein